MWTRKRRNWPSSATAYRPSQLLNRLWSRKILQRTMAFVSLNPFTLPLWLPSCPTSFRLLLRRRQPARLQRPFTPVVLRYSPSLPPPIRTHSSAPAIRLSLHFVPNDRLIIIHFLVIYSYLFVNNCYLYRLFYVMYFGKLSVLAIIQFSVVAIVSMLIIIIK